MKAIAKLTKTYTEIETVEFYHIALDKWPYDAGFRKAREGSNPLDECFKCGHKFQEGEMMSVGFAIKTTNKVFCHGCAENLLKEGKND